MKTATKLVLTLIRLNNNVVDIATFHSASYLSLKVPVENKEPTKPHAITEFFDRAKYFD